MDAPPSGRQSQKPHKSRCKVQPSVANEAQILVQRLQKVSGEGLRRQTGNLLEEADIPSTAAASVEPDELRRRLRPVEQLQVRALV